MLTKLTLISKKFNTSLNLSLCVLVLEDESNRAFKNVCFLPFYLLALSKLLPGIKAKQPHQEPGLHLKFYMKLTI